MKKALPMRNANGINLREHDSQGLMPFKLSISNTVMVLQWA